jgi:glycosyltransferase involved in cell wall biosynthesis
MGSALAAVVAHHHHVIEGDALKVLIVHDYGTLHGGAEQMSITLRNGLRARGHDARLFASTAQPLPLPNVADHTCYGTMTSARRVLQVVNPSAAMRLRALLREYRPDVLHVRMFLTQLSPLILPLLRQVPSLLHVVNYDLICPLNTKLLPDGSACHERAGMSCYRNGCLPPLGVARTMSQRLMWRWWSDAFDLIVTNSQWVRRRLAEEGIAVDETVWNGVPVRPQRPPLGSIPIVAFAGRFVAKKGVDVLLRAMAQVVAHIPDAMLLLAGDGPERPDIEAAIAAYRLTPHVRVLGYLPKSELEHQFSHAWVQAVPSLWEEPFGLVTAEAMMRGTATVASDTGGTSELVQNGISGFTIPPGDIEGLAQALICLLSNRQLAEKMGQAGRRRALAEFSEDRAVVRFEQLYAQLLSRPTKEYRQSYLPSGSMHAPLTGL